MFFILKSDISILEALGYSLLGIAIVFAALLLLMAIIKIQSTLMSKGKEKKPAAAAAPAAAPAPAAPAQAKPAAPGSAGEIKLYDVPDKTAAMIMAIVADTLKKPLNELRFKSIKEVK
ncbi:MAG: OadG family transporter subunit [Clostridiaceae bacterium]|nr:OadG family transporter subunit [Clostridiaceae bacterium]